MAKNDMCTLPTRLSGIALHCNSTHYNYIHYTHTRSHL